MSALSNGQGTADPPPLVHATALSNTHDDTAAARWTGEIMSNAYVIEAGEEAAGIVVREGNGFRFLSSSRRFWSLDGQYYRTPRDAERASIGLLSLRQLHSRRAPQL